VEAPIDWDTVEALPAPSEGCESAAASPHDRQVARVIPQQPTPGSGRPLLVLGTLLLLLNQLLQQQPGPPGPSESFEGEWWDDDNDSSDGAAGGVDGDGGGGVYAEGD